MDAHTMDGQRRIDWDAQPLGKQRDTELARALAVSKYVVWRERRKRGIAKAAVTNWANEPLGKEPDAVVAQRLGLERSTVAFRRRRRGIRFRREIDWDAQPYATKSDAEIADLLGVTPRTVGIQRRARRILRRHQSDAALEIKAAACERARCLSSDRVAIDWAAQPLGRMSDVEIAKMLGVSAHAVRRQRLRRGVVSAVKARDHTINWDAQPLGKVSDEDLASELAVSRNVVRFQRQKRGIASATRPGRRAGDRRVLGRTTARQAG